MTKMTATATAIWNDKEGYWDVDISQTYENDEINIDSHNTVKVCDCDEVVIAEALMEANGIVVNGLFADNHFPIVK